MAPIIQFNNVSKQYYLGNRKAYLRYLLPEFAKRNWNTNSRYANDDIIWAIKNVTFEVQPGEVLGLIGPNGAGKTTTLSLLAGITSPTEGSINIRGRVGALIQLGAGFHPELTGRENIYLNGIIMGLSKRKVSQIIDEIIHFAELEKFIDTPIKRYSSGMYVRLGFSVAIQINPEILLIDEVLAVGDVAFKAKCYNKIRDLRKSGATVVIVSHELAQIKNLCDRAILIKNNIITSGEVDKVIDAYYKIVFQGDKSTEDLKDAGQLPNVNLLPAYISKVELANQNGENTNQFKTGDSLKIIIQYQANECIVDPAFGISIQTAEGAKLIGVNTKVDEFQIGSIEGAGTIEFVIPELHLLPGTYMVGAVLHDRFMGAYDRKLLANRFHIVSGPSTIGVFMPPHYWHLSS